jgi:hypothetical protein
VDVGTVKPILDIKAGEVKLGYNVGTRGNGVDQLRRTRRSDDGDCEMS